MRAEDVLKNIEVRGPDADGDVWLVFKRPNWVLEGAVNLGRHDRITAQIAKIWNENRLCALATMTPDTGEGMTETMIKAGIDELCMELEMPDLDHAANIEDAMRAVYKAMRAARPVSGGEVK